MAAEEYTSTKCVDNDLIPHFLQFWSPTNGVSSEQAVKTFQWRFLKYDQRKIKHSVIDLHDKIDVIMSEI